MLARNLPDLADTLCLLKEKKPTESYWILLDFTEPERWLLLVCDSLQQLTHGSPMAGVWTDMR